MPQDVSAVDESSETLRNFPWLHFSNVWQDCNTLSLLTSLEVTEFSKLTTNLEQDQHWENLTMGSSKHINYEANHEFPCCPLASNVEKTEKFFRLLVCPKDGFSWV